MARPIGGLIAVAEVRDVTPVRDENGNVVALPEVEHVLVGCLDAIREARSSLPGADALEWNRIMLLRLAGRRPPARGVRCGGPTAGAAHRRAGPGAGGGQRRVWRSGGAEPVEAVVRIGYEPGHGVTVRLTDPPTEPM